VITLHLKTDSKKNIFTKGNVKIKAQNTEFGNLMDYYCTT